MTTSPPIATVDPTTGDVLETFQPLTDRELEERLALAARGAAEWASTDIGTRARTLITAAELLEGELPDIAFVLTKEMG
ncbi:MAG: aldehyde dehydrogenase family protein, partial [Actinomycetota bacterium]|nr:aldehyde dehydrogenase family protein [Actinomycetota bacterium]